MAEPPVDPPAAGPSVDASGEGGVQSKKGAKKAEAKAKKEAEKARRAAEVAARQAQAKSASAAEDTAKDSYGDDGPQTRSTAAKVHLRDVGEQHVGTAMQLRAWIQNARMQGAKMAFVELREERNWTIQGIVTATNPDDTSSPPVSRQMVKWVGALRNESFVLVEATVQKPVEPVKSTRVSDFELHITRCYCIAPGPEKLALGLAQASKAVSRIDDEDPAESAAAAAMETMSVSESVGSGAVGAGVAQATLATHLNNPVMHKRAPVQQAIADVRMTVRKLFAEYLDSQGFNQFEPPCLIGAASEGGANVFRLPYFEKDAFLAQSPQFYKQIEIAGGRKRVYCIGPVFRAENSNTPRHMTEVRSLATA